MRKHRGVPAVIGLILVLGVGVVFSADIRGFFRSALVIPPGVWSRPFNAAVWQSKQATKGQNSIRSQMADDLISSKRLIGMSKLQVAKLLGKPGTSYDSVFEYLLGRERGSSGIDYEILRVTFNRSGKAVKAEISVT